MASLSPVRKLGAAVLGLPFVVVLGRVFAAERDRWVLWLPVGFGFGIGLYFALPTEPPRWTAIAWTLLCLGLGVICRRVRGVAVTALALGVVGLGVVIAEQRTDYVAAPLLTQKVGPSYLTGRVLYIATSEKRQRLLLDRLQIEKLPAAATPARVRVTTPARHEPIHPGDWVRLRAELDPPPPPAAPGTLDFPRQAFFQRLGAVGFSIGLARVVAAPVDAPPETRIGAFTVWLNGLRQRLLARVTAELPGATGGLAAALMTGDRTAIPEDVIKAMQDSGLAHLLVIAGLHLSFVAGILFFSVRLLLAAIPSIALNYPTKKWAAAATLAGTFAYLMISGATVPTQRAFLMTSVAVLAVLLDRQALSMRVVAWAALLVLGLQPESLLDVSFQMSFAAVVGLIATYEVASGPMARMRSRTGWLGHGLSHLAGVGLTTLVAGLATAPFALFHFNRFVDYGLLGNMLAVPLVGIWVMPWAIVAFLLMPFGLEGIALVPMGWGVGAVIGIARGVAGLPGAVLLFPPLPLWGLLLTSAGGLWLCLWRQPWRLAGVAPIIVGLAAIWLTPRPDILIDGEAKFFAVRAADGALMVSPARGLKMAEQSWLQHDGEREPAPWPTEGASSDGRLRCDALGCIYRAEGMLIALPRDEAALAEDCQGADVVLSAVPVRGRCSGARVVVDRFDLWRHGGHAIYLQPDGRVRIETVEAWRGERPWSPPATPHQISK
jgi:competence protein ComEC